MGNWDAVVWIEAYLYIVTCVKPMARHCGALVSLHRNRSDEAETGR